MKKNPKKTYLVIRPLWLHNKALALNESIELSERQARPLCYGGFISADKTVAEKIALEAESHLHNKKSPSKSTSTHIDNHKNPPKNTKDKK